MVQVTQSTPYSLDLTSDPELPCAGSTRTHIFEARTYSSERSAESMQRKRTDLPIQSQWVPLWVPRLRCESHRPPTSLRHTDTGLPGLYQVALCTRQEWRPTGRLENEQTGSPQSSHARQSLWQDGLNPASGTKNCPAQSQTRAQNTSNCLLLMSA